MSDDKTFYAHFPPFDDNVAQVGGDRTAMLRLLDRVRDLVANGQASGVMVLWELEESVDSDVEGVWSCTELKRELRALLQAQEYVSDLAVEEQLRELGA